MLNKESNGWGAYQNIKKKFEIAKTQQIIQNENNFGERIKLNKYNNFENIVTKVNPFRFPNKITTEEINIETPNNNINIMELQEFDNDELKEQISMLSKYRTKLSKNAIKIQTLTDEYNKSFKQLEEEYSVKFEKLEEDYKNAIKDTNNKCSKISKLIDLLEEELHDIILEKKTNEDAKTNEDINNNTTLIETNENNQQMTLEETSDNNATVIKYELGDNNNVESAFYKGDNEHKCVIEVDNKLYNAYYEYSAFTDTTIYMSPNSIVKHNGNAVNFTYNKQDNCFNFYINNKLIKISYKRPRTSSLKKIFISDTIIRHKAVNEVHRWYKDPSGKLQLPNTSENRGEVNLNFEEYCIYIKSKNKFIKCDKNGFYTEIDEYKTMSQFIIDNYKKHIPYYNNTQIKSFDYLEYYCKNKKDFISFKEIKHDSIIN
jgi:hypothetical protein